MFLSWLTALEARRRRERFYPSFVSFFFNPTVLYGRQLAAAMRTYAPLLSGRVLDIGCGGKPYRHLISCAEYIGVDVELPSGHDHTDEEIDVFYDGRTLPFADSSFDWVFTSEVLEHVFDPNMFVAEMARVLKPCGQVLLTVPFLYHEHEQPYDYGRYTSYGLKHLLHKSGFSVVHQDRLGHAADVIGQLMLSYMTSITRAWPALLKFPLRLIIVPSVACLALLCRCLPRHEAYFLGQIILAKKDVQ